MQSEKKHIVIVGGGFGGLYTLKNLKKLLSMQNVAITLISKQNYFTFTPLIHEVATGGLNAEHVIEPIRKFTLPFCNFIEDEVVEVDFAQKLIKTKNGKIINYDYLVLATGAETNFYGIKGCKENVLVLKSLDDAVRVKGELISLFENGAKSFCVAIVGAGATGTELAAEIAEFVYGDLLKFYPSVLRENVRVCLINNGSRILPDIDERLALKAEKYLNKLGVEVLNNKSVTSIEPGTFYTVNFAGGDKLKVSKVVWCAGVTCVLSKIIGEYQTDKDSRLVVDAFLRVLGQSNVFALGDVAAGFPMLAHTATAESEIVAFNVAQLVLGKTEPKLKKFKYRQLGRLVSLGRKNAIANIFGVKMTGRHVWFIWRTVYFFKTISWNKKLKIGLNWFINLFEPRDVSRVW